MDAAKLVSAALLGIDGETVIIGGKAYYIAPPTIKRIAGAGMYLADLNVGGNLSDVLSQRQVFTNMTKALSWFINGDESISEELGEGTLEELCKAFESAIRLMGIENFLRLSVSVKSVKMLIAKQR